MEAALNVSSFSANSAELAIALLVARPDRLRPYGVVLPPAVSCSSFDLTLHPSCVEGPGSMKTCKIMKLEPPDPSITSANNTMFGFE